MVPPRFVRRLVLAPLVVVLTLAMIVLTPLLLLAALVTPSRNGRRRRMLRLIWFALVRDQASYDLRRWTREG